MLKLFTKAFPLHACLLRVFICVLVRQNLDALNSVPQQLPLFSLWFPIINGDAAEQAWQEFPEQQVIYLKL